MYFITIATNKALWSIWLGRFQGVIKEYFLWVFGWREQRRENWWSLGVFSLGPPKCFLPNPGENWRENQGLCFGQNCPSQHSDFLNFFDFFAFFFSMLSYHFFFLLRWSFLWFFILFSSVLILSFLYSFGFSFFEKKVLGSWTFFF